MLKPGGVLALVTSHYTLDKQDAGLREMLSSQADFLGAIRLPSSAFAREGTRVVTDILCSSQAHRAVVNHTDPTWLETEPLAIEGVDIPINRYFLRHPEMVLGRGPVKTASMPVSPATASLPMATWPCSSRAR